MSGTVLTALSAPRPQAPSVARRTATLLPDGAAVVVVANRAFGCPIFTDQITTRGWDWVVRVQRQTRWKDHHGHVQPLRQQVRAAGERWKGQGQLFKDAGWRRVSALVLWGRAHREPLLLASSLPLQWELFAIYKQRAAIKTLFRGWKTSGWQWEASQVTDLEHHERLLLGLAFASLITLMQCTQAAAQKRQTPAHGTSAEAGPGRTVCCGWGATPSGNACGGMTARRSGGRWRASIARSSRQKAAPTMPWLAQELGGAPPRCWCVGMRETRCLFICSVRP